MNFSRATAGGTSASSIGATRCRTGASEHVTGAAMPLLGGGDRQSANDVELDFIRGDSESAGLLSSITSTTHTSRQAAPTRAERGACTVRLLVMLGLSLLVVCVLAVSTSLGPSFPRQPPNRDVPGVATLVLGSQWGSSKEFAHCLSSESKGEELEVGSSVLEGRLLGGTWHYYKFRMKDLNVSFDAEFHQYLPQFEDLLSPNRSSASCSTVGGVNGSAIALVRVGELPSLMTHDSSSCNRCRALGQRPCGLVCGSTQWVYVGIFAPVPAVQQEAQLTPPSRQPFEEGTGGGAVSSRLESRNMRYNEGLGLGVESPAADAAHASLRWVDYRFRMLVSGRCYLHLLDLPRCDFAQVCMHAQPCFRLARDSSPFASWCLCCVVAAQIHFKSMSLSALRTRQEGYSPKFLYFVFLPSLGLCLPLVAFFWGFALIRSWRLHSENAGEVLDALVGRTVNRHRRRRGQEGVAGTGIW